MRILTSAASGDPSRSEIESKGCESARSLGIALHLLSPGLPTTLTAAQEHAERQVWLGADREAIESGEAQALCDQISLGLADLVIWCSPEPASTESDDAFAVLRTAALAMKPVIWIDPQGSVRLLDLSVLSPARRHLIFSGEAAQGWFSDCVVGPCEASDLSRWMSSMAVVPFRSSQTPAEGLVQGSRAGWVHNALIALVQGKVRRAWGALRAKPITPYRGLAWSAAGDLVGPTPSLDATFDSADLIASVAAGKHRSSVWISSIASTTAVFAAVAGAIGLWPGHEGTFWALAEVALVSVVILLLWRVKRLDWHGRWISSRFLAEQVRYARMGLPLLALGQRLYEPFRCLVAGAGAIRRVAVLSEEIQSLHRSLADLGLPGPAGGGPFVAASRTALIEQRDYVLSVIDDQIRYHDRVHSDQHKAHHTLHTATVALFCLTGAAVLGHFVLHAQWLLIFTAFFPALAAGIHGLATALEISRIAEQSKATAEQLRELASAIRSTMTSEASAWHRWFQLRRLTLAAAELMSDENGQWHKLVNHQKPKLPA